MRREIPKRVLDKQDYWDEEFKEKLKVFFGFEDEFRASGKTYILAETLLSVALKDGGNISYALNEYVRDEVRKNILHQELIHKIREVIEDYEYSKGISIKIKVQELGKSFRVISNMSYIGDVHPIVIQERFLKSREYHLNKNK